MPLDIVRDAFLQDLRQILIVKIGGQQIGDRPEQHTYLIDVFFKLAHSFKKTDSRGDIFHTGTEQGGQ